MIVLPEIRSVARPGDASDAIEIGMIVPGQLYFLEGHFPGCPLLPGVVQLNWAIEFARRHLPVSGEFRGVAALKFMRVIQPDRSVALRLRFDAANRQLSFEYRNDSGVCASGVVNFRQPVAANP